MKEQKEKKRMIISFLAIVSATLLIACGGSASEPVSAEAKYANEDYEEDLDICYVCGKVEEEGGYYVECGDDFIFLCKECRDELMINNGFVVVDGEKIRPFSTRNLYRDDLACFPIPNDYAEGSSRVDNPFWKEVLVYKKADDVYIYFGWENILDENDNSIEREAMTIPSGEIPDSLENAAKAFLEPEEYAEYAFSSLAS